MDLFERGIALELIGIGAFSRHEAARCVDLAKHKPHGHLMRAMPTPDAVSQLVTDNGRLIVFDRLSVRHQSRDKSGLLLQSETRSALESRLIDAVLGVPATVQGGIGRIWVKLSPGHAEQPVHQIRQQRAHPSRLPDAAHFREAHLIQPEALAERQLRELRQGDSVTVITGSAFLEVANRYDAAMRKLEERTIRDTLSCIARGVSYRYVALEGSEAEKSLVDMREWIDSLSLSSTDGNTSALDVSMLRQLFSLKIAPEDAKGECFPWQRIVLLEQFRSPDEPDRRQMFVSAFGTDGNGYDVMFCYESSHEHRSRISKLISGSRDFTGQK